MPFTNITNDFRSILQEKESTVPDSKRRKLSKHGRHDGERDGQASLSKEYLAEAYTILNHVNTLTRMLANIRKPYLNVDTRTSPLARHSSQKIDFNQGDSAWAGIRNLSNEERDQIDLQAKVILTRCSERVKEMEALEKRRVELVAKNINPLTRLLPARLRQDESTLASDFVAAHHSSITWYLSRRLTEASQTQKEMQEERVKRQMERTRTLGSGAAREAQIMGDPISSAPSLEGSGTGSWLGDASSNLLAATLGVPSTNNSSASVPAPETSYASEDDEYDDIELSASQILQFETENANILRSVQDTLESVQQAESRLMDISALQMELISHLTRQTELTEQLYEDAIATTSTVEKGNVQLKEAKRRAKDGRLFILVFLIGASLSLLFLHYY
ncbi:hypothetical protein BDQ12DRAFT_643221 [Crucibulum laeve]|uniref:SNARE-complex protein Syntaxin-18 N-terminal domain-containing protein n=1 Tax=Crucibulum laeve TaxID=68775 RepID=A0A5C3MI73_9AGAR|nr:hypothetical protein BDQ12DRAFT_643221 [Crucibulum laeve]